MRYEVFELSAIPLNFSSVIEVKVDSTAAIFDEHFPGNPVVPGAFILGLLLACCRSILPGVSVLVKRAVFLEPIRPGSRLELILKDLDRVSKKEIVFQLGDGSLINCRGSISVE